MRKQIATVGDDLHVSRVDREILGMPHPSVEEFLLERDDGKSMAIHPWELRTLIAVLAAQQDRLEKLGVL